MGACFSERPITAKSSESFFNLKSAKKFGTQNSSIKFQIQSWEREILPNLRDQSTSKILETIFNDEGCLTYNASQKDLVFEPSAKNNSELPISKNLSKKSLSINVQKIPTGYKVTFLNDFIYELVSSKRQIIEGDKFLFGGTEYKFLKFINDSKYTEEKVKSVKNIRDPDIVRTQEYMKSLGKIQVDDENENPVCRICLEGQTNKADPLICPCDCIGSVKYFHLKCWSSWIFSSQVSKEGIYIGNVIKDECEICKKNMIKNKLFRETVAALLSSAAKIKPPLVVLEGMKPRDDFPYYRNVKLNYIILSFADQDKFLVGRGKATDIPLCIDNSISRHNSYLKIKEGKVFLEDAGSKHGTYLKVKSPILVQNDVPRFFLFENKLFSMRIQ